MSRLTRREMIGGALLGAAWGMTGKIFAEDEKKMEQSFDKPEGFKGNIHQSVSKWCFGKIPYPEFCGICVKMGMVGVDLVHPEDWKTVAEGGLTVTMGSLPGVSIPDGLNRKENHEKLIAIYEKYIPMAAECRVPNVICMSGNRGDLDDATGIANCVAGLKQIIPLAERHGVNVVMELLNEKDHADYQCSRTAWGAKVAEGVGSSRFKLLYDIYHMQRMEGEIINNIRTFHQYIGHYHTGGNPGRNDIDETQEIYYPAIMRAILETGFTGFVAHEFIPKKGLESLYNAVRICDV